MTLRKDPFQESRMLRLHFPLDFERMNVAAAELLHFTDFTSFSKLHTDVKTNNCRVTEAYWRPGAEPVSGSSRSRPTASCATWFVPSSGRSSKSGRGACLSRTSLPSSKPRIAVVLARQLQDTPSISRLSAIPKSCIWTKLLPHISNK